MSDKNLKESIISKAFDNWANKIWFQVVACIVILYIMITPVLGPIIYNTINKQNTTEAVVDGIQVQKEKDSEKHKNDFEKSRQMYASAKAVLKEHLGPSGADYIFLIEYHNGVDNVMTGIQFCRFDITLEILKENLRYINHDKFRDDIVARYDLLLNEEFQNSTKVHYYTVEELWDVDRYLEKHILSIEGKAIAISNLSTFEGKIWGTLLFVTTEQPLKLAEIYKCHNEIDKIFKK